MNASRGQPPADDGEPPWELLDRYFSGTSTADESARVHAWEHAVPGRARELEAVRAIWAQSAETPGARPVWDTERMVADLRARIRAEQTRGEQPNQSPGAAHPRASRVGRSVPVADAASPSPTRSPRLAWLAQHWPVSASAAAAVAVVATTVVISHGWLPAAFSPIGDFETPRAARASVTLRDGTVLTLGPATHLRVPREFGYGTRTVELDGEALFSVVHDPRHPFVVKTARTVIRDVGTTFSVVAYARDPGTEVAVAEGEVTVGGAALEAHDVGTIGVTGRLTVRHQADVRPFVAWSQGSLVFVNTPLRDVMRALERTYDLQITLADTSLGAQLITATFTNEPADMVLDDLTAIVGAGYVRSARAVVIRRRPRHGAHLREASYARRASDSPYQR